MLNEFPAEQAYRIIEFDPIVLIAKSGIDGLPQPDNDGFSHDDAARSTLGRRGHRTVGLQPSSAVQNGRMCAGRVHCGSCRDNDENFARILIEKVHIKVYPDIIYPEKLGAGNQGEIMCVWQWWQICHSVKKL